MTRKYPLSCPHRNGTPTLLGQLGAFIWLRCRHCGTDWASHADDTDDTQETS